MALPKKFPLVPALLLQLPAWLADTASWNGGWGGRTGDDRTPDC